MGWLLVCGLLTTVIGGVAWYTRKPVDGGYGVGYESIEAAISPFITVVGILIVLAVVLDWTGVW